MGTSGEKIALDGNNGWVGSTNATRGLANQIDWGMITQGAMTASLHQRFEENWNAASMPVYKARNRMKKPSAERGLFFMPPRAPRLPHESARAA